MYKMSKNLRLTAIILMIVGAVGLIYSFIDAPSSVEEVQEMLAAEHHGDVDASQTASAADAAQAKNDHEGSHADHVLTQLKNKPWTAIYTSTLFFFLLALGAFAFYTIQHASQAGWSPVLFRVMEGISQYMLPGGIILFVLFVFSAFNMNQIFIWMDPDIVANDPVIAAKTGYLNVPFFLIRAIIYIGGWVLLSKMIIGNSRKLDNTPDMKLHKKNFKLSAIFLVFFIVTESMMSWDWIMSIDTHWFSTLFGWYVFASMFVAGITAIALVTVYLKKLGYLDFVHSSHIHDLAKYMFAFSIFWTYLWFSQFLLIWYSNIPEEVTYYAARIQDYQLPFFGMLALNFIFPTLILMNSDFKRINWIVIFSGIIILVGHYLNFYVMISPGTVGASWFIGIPEISSILLIAGLFIFVVFNAIGKVNLLPKNNPFLKESKDFH
ncbi:MAG: hypothetical protein L0J48_03250 [Alkalibacterium sp.]|nr:quinol:cytochrome C oxidoreductase [Psychroflexus sp.]MDN6327025.1 hypothetical protein [Alkalibacterium sp.]